MSVRAKSLQTLLSWERSKGHLDGLIDTSELKNKEVALYYQLVFGTVRFLKRIDYILADRTAGRFIHLPKPVKWALRMGI
jgi:hypothetical protein